MKNYPDPFPLDLGCGKTKCTDGRKWWGVDIRPFDAVDEVVDLKGAWPWSDNSVDEARASHVVEHFHMSEERPDRINFVNELYRVLKPGAKAMLITPNWSSCRAYGDYTHVWPPVSTFWFFYLNRAWRLDNAPHCDLYKCDFDFGCGGTVHPHWQVRAQEAVQFAQQFYIEATPDLICTLTKRA